MVNVSLQAVKVFEAAARLESFKDAADELSITATAVSHHISNLEHRLGVKLFYRKVREITLTSEGKKLSQATTASLQKIATTLDEIQLGASSIKVHTTSSFAALVLIPSLHNFNELYPNIEVDISTGEVVDHQINNLSIRFGDVDRVDDESILKIEQFNLYGNPSLIARPSTDRPAPVYLTKWKNKDLPDAPWLSWLEANRKSPQDFTTNYFDQELYGVNEAIAGKSLIFCSETLVSDLVKAGVLEPISTLPVESKLCYYIPNRSKELNTKMLTFVDWITDRFS